MLDDFHIELERVQSLMRILITGTSRGTRAALMSSDQSREEHMKHADGEMDGAKMAPLTTMISLEDAFLIWAEWLPIRAHWLWYAM